VERERLRHPEMARRQDNLRRHMDGVQLDAVLLSSYHNINYFADFLYCSFWPVLWLRRYARQSDLNQRRDRPAYQRVDLLLGRLMSLCLTQWRRLGSGPIN
jgi:hypothetical protein